MWWFPILRDMGAISKLSTTWSRLLYMKRHSLLNSPVALCRCISYKGQSGQKDYEEPNERRSRRHRKYEGFKEDGRYQQTTSDLKGKKYTPRNKDMPRTVSGLYNTYSDVGENQQDRVEDWRGSDYSRRQLTDWRQKEGLKEKGKKYSKFTYSESDEDGRNSSKTRRLNDVDYLDTGTDQSKENWRKTDLPPDWSETFGTLGTDADQLELQFATTVDTDKYLPDTEKDDSQVKVAHHIPLSRYNRRHIPNWYGRRIQKLGKAGKVKEAIEVFDKWMIEQDRVRPTSFEFVVLIDLLAQCGYTEKAFQLFKRMKKMGIYMKPIVYTCMFNACANSPWPEDGLQHARRLRREMLRTETQPKFITYQAMIKAFGMCGDIDTAFSVADEASRFKMNENSLASLLTACISNEEAGFRYALLVWRRFRRMGIRPSLKHYNLLIRAINQCGIGHARLGPELLMTGSQSGQIQSWAGSQSAHTQIKTGSPAYFRSQLETESHLWKVNDSHELLDTSQDNIINDRKSKRNKLSKRQKKNIAQFEKIDTMLEKYDFSLDHSNDGTNVTPLNEDIENIPGNDQHEDNDKDNRMANLESVDEVIDTREWWELDVFSKSFVKASPSELSLQENSTKLPSILDPNETLSSAVHIEDINTAQDRFALLGGLDGFLQAMKQNNISGDIVTFTQLIKSVPNHQENDIIVAMQIAGVHADIDFYNHLIEKRAKGRHLQALEVWKLIKSEGLVPNLRTFGCLAGACKSRETGNQLIDDMLDADLMPNAVIMTQLLVASYLNFNYKKDVLQKMTLFGIKPTAMNVAIIESDIAKAKQNLVDKEKGMDVSGKGWLNDAPRFAAQLKSFISFYEKWSKYNTITQAKEDPWKTFR